MPETRDGWLVLFDGGTPVGWQMAGPGGFELVDGTLRSHGGMGLLWYAARRFEDLELRLEWRVERPEDNSGVFLRFPDPGDDPWVAVQHGYEVQILDVADEPERRTGSVYTFAAPSSVPTRPPGSWNALAVRAVGQAYAVAVNGVEVTTFTGDRGLDGFVGIQNHDDASRVAFRDIRARPLGGGTP